MSRNFYEDPFGNGFDKHFDKVEKNAGRIAGLAVVLWIIGALASLTITGLVIYILIQLAGKL